MTLTSIEARYGKHTVTAYQYAPGRYVWRETDPRTCDWEWLVGELVTPPPPEPMEYEEIELNSDRWTVKARHKRTHTPPAVTPYLVWDLAGSVNALSAAAQAVALAVLGRSE